VSIQVEFALARPLSHYSDLQGLLKRRYEDSEPTAPPDIDKLARAVLDALTGIVYDDDSQVIELQATKRFDTHPHATIEVVSYAKA
jgi:Holliday junction resolvase RusA-like endonuclease